MLAPGGKGEDEEPLEPRARFSLYRRLLIGGVVAALLWLLLPRVPSDHTVAFVLGSAAPDVARLDVYWESRDGKHEGQVTLNFPAPTPERVVRRFRMTDGSYAFRITALHRDATRGRTELVRQVTLDGSDITLRLDELSP